MFLLVTGASGAGKSTVRRLIAGDLSPEVHCVELTDVVDLPRVMSIAWRQEATEAVVARAVELQGEGRHLLLAGDPVPAAEVLAAPSADRLEGFAACLLDVEPDMQAARLAARGDDPGLLDHHQAFAAWMRAQARDPRHMLEVVTTNGWEAMRWERLDRLDPEAGNWAMHVLEASRLSREQVAEAVLRWCRDLLAGPTPVPPTRPAPSAPVE